MNTIGSRIEEVLKAFGIKKTEAAQRLNVSSAFISMVCKGDSGISDRTIADFCREFRVREEWLRTGEGEMYLQLTPDQERAAFLSAVISGESSPEVNAFIDALKATSNDDLKTVIDFVAKVYEAHRKNTADPGSANNRRE